MKKDPQLALNQIAQILFDKKGFNILALDVRGVSTMTDYFIIAEGNVDKHVIALGNAVVSALKSEEGSPSHMEGMTDGDWVVIDYMDVVIHLFKPGMREMYHLEEVWQQGKVIDLKLDVSERLAAQS